MSAAIPANRLTMTEAERLAFWRNEQRGNVTASDLAARAGRPWKTCPDCGRFESATWICSGCFLPMGPADWTTLPAEDGRGASLVAARAKRASATGTQADAANPGGVA